MKKSLLALAVLGAFASAASAQSSVTIYGSIDQAVAKGNGGTATNPGGLGSATAVAATTGVPYSAVAVNATAKAVQMIQSHTSRLGFRGNEDLGGGLSAQFLIEHRFNPDTGAQNSAAQFWNGASYVQLTSAAAGSVFLGRWYTPVFLLANRLDPFGWDGVGQTGSNQYGNYCQPDNIAAATLATCAGTNVRTSNTVGYRTPNLGGFVGTVSGSLSEGTQNGRVFSGTATYGAGPIFIGVGAEQVSKGAFDKTGLYQLGGSYDLGVTKLIGYVARSSYGAAGDFHANVYQVAALTPIGGGNLKAAYSRVDPKTGNLRQKVGLGYDYFLSKRTNLYLDGSFAKEENRTRNSAFALGVRHDF